MKPLDCNKLFFYMYKQKYLLAFLVFLTDEVRAVAEKTDPKDEWCPFCAKTTKNVSSHLTLHLNLKTVPKEAQHDVLSNIRQAVRKWKRTYFPGGPKTHFFSRTELFTLGKNLPLSRVQEMVDAFYEYVLKTISLQVDITKINRSFRKF